VSSSEAGDDGPFAPHPQVLLTELPDGKAVLLHLGTKVYYTLNSTGLVVWRALAAGERRADAIVAQLVEGFDVTDDRARGDVAKVLSDLREARLLA